MAVLTVSQINDLAAMAGFRTNRKISGYSEREWAVAIALAESDGNTEAHNTKAPDNSYGLWQINMYGPLGPERREQFGISSNDALLNPVVNAQAAWNVFRQSNYTFRPWSTYPASALAEMPKVKGSDKQPDVTNPGYGEAEGPPDLNPLDNIADVLGNIGDVLAFITDGKNWQRVGLFLGGAIVVIIAVALFANSADVLPVNAAKLVKQVTK